MRVLGGVEMSKNRDVVIVGSGIAGSLAALALGRKGKKVLLVERALQPPANGADFLKPSGIKVLKKLGLEEKLHDRGALRRHRIHYYHNGEEIINYNYREHVFPGYYMIIPYGTQIRLIMERLKAMPNVETVFGTTVTQHKKEGNNLVALTLSDGRTFQPELVIASDGARSQIREQLGIAVERKTYDTLIHMVTSPLTDSVEKSNRLYMSSTGEIAYIYPLSSTQQRCAIVLPNSSVETIRKMTSNELVQHMRRFVTESDDVLEQGLDLSQSHGYAPGHMHARSYCSGNTLLLGSAILTVHPFTGQGMNLAIEEVDSLLEALTEVDAGNRTLPEALEIHARQRRVVNNKLLAYSDSLVNSYKDKDQFLANFNFKLHGSSRYF